MSVGEVDYDIVRRLSKRLEAPEGKSEAETRRTTVTRRPRVTWSGDHLMPEIHVGSMKVNWDHSKSWV